MPLQVYSTLSRKKEPFHKSPPDEVTMYVCGPTVYKPSHIGHMVGPVIFDTVKRYLQYLGYKVNWVVNITDVDDKLIIKAAEQNTTVKELAEKMTADYLDCLQKLNVTGIDKMPKATEHINGMIEVISSLVQKNYAYPAEGDVYFNVTQDSDYGKLCGFDPEQLEAGSRIEVSGKKRSAGDFALWKASKPGEPSWDSPWGPGRPGWHIECTCMATALLGKTLDIHGGGLDLRFPHHENEMAQSESYTGEPFAKIWMHNGLLKWGNEKMAGSKGNVLNVVDALGLVGGEVLRFFMLNTHYRSPIDLGDWKPEKEPIPPGISMAKTAYETFVRFTERYQRISGKSFLDLEAGTRIQRERTFGVPSLKDYFDRFVGAMDDDFNTGAAVGILFELITSLNRLADTTKLEDPSTKDDSAKRAFEEGSKLLKELGQILGLFFEEPKSKSLGGDDNLVSGMMSLLIDLRNTLRTTAKGIADKNDPTRKALFEQTDVIRKRLADLGVTLEDRPGGTVWRVG